MESRVNGNLLDADIRYAVRTIVGHPNSPHGRETYERIAPLGACGNWHAVCELIQERARNASFGGMWESGGRFGFSVEAPKPVATWAWASHHPLQRTCWTVSVDDHLTTVDHRGGRESRRGFLSWRQVAEVAIELTASYGVAAEGQTQLQRN